MTIIMRYDRKITALFVVTILQLLSTCKSWAVTWYTDEPIYAYAQVKEPVFQQWIPAICPRPGQPIISVPVGVAVEFRAVEGCVPLATLPQEGQPYDNDSYNDPPPVSDDVMCDWDFDDGDGSAFVATTDYKQHQISYTFENPGRHIVKMKAWDGAQQFRYPYIYQSGADDYPDIEQDIVVDVDPAISLTLTASQTSIYACESVTLTATALDKDLQNGSEAFDRVENFTWSGIGAATPTYSYDPVTHESNSTVTIKWSDINAYEVGVTVDDMPCYFDDGPETRTELIDVIALQEPEATAVAKAGITATGPWQGRLDVGIGQAVYFSGEDSYDKDCSPANCALLNDPIAGYQWNFGDGQVGSGLSVSHTYTTPGTFWVSLAVDDAGTIVNDPQSALTDLEIRVFADPPAAPVIITPSKDSSYNGLCPTVRWNGELHDMYEVRIGEVIDAIIDDDPDAPAVWTSGVVEDGISEAKCSVELEEGKLYYVFVREHNVLGWGSWSATRHRFNVKYNGYCPSNESLSPNTGNLLTGTCNSFTAVYRDYCGSSNIKSAQLLIDETTLDKIDACYIIYEQVTNLCWLAGSDGTTMLGGYAPGSSEILENNLVRIHLAQTSVSATDTDLSVTWMIEFKDAIAGDKTLALAVNNNAGLADPDNFEIFGTISVEANGPKSKITSPLNGTCVGSIPITITGTASDDIGVQKVEVSTDGGQTWNEASGTTSWSYTWNCSSDATYLLKSRMTSTTQQQEEPGTGIKVTVDTKPPYSRITSPSDGVVITGGAIFVTGIASDESNRLAKVELSFDDGVTWVTASGKDFFSYNYPVSADGTFVISSRAYDEAGHIESPTSRIIVTVDYGLTGEVSSGFGSGVPNSSDVNRIEAQGTIDVGPYSVLNLCTKEMRTTLPVVSWDCMGDISINFSLIHSEGLGTEIWRHSYDSYITETDYTTSATFTVNLIELNHPNGDAQHWYCARSLSDSSLSYVTKDWGHQDPLAKVGDHDILSVLGEGGYVVESPNRIKMFYTQKDDSKKPNRWRMKYIEYPGGKRITFEYDPIKRYQLLSVKGPDEPTETAGGRYLKLIWKNNNIIAVSHRHPNPLNDSLIQHTFTYANQSMTYQAPGYAQTDKLYVPSKTKEDPLYPEDNPCDFSQKPRWVEFKWIGYSNKISQVSTPSANPNKVRDDWTYTEDIEGGYYIKKITNPDGKDTTVAYADPKSLPRMRGEISANELQETIVTNACGNRTTYRHVKWICASGDEIKNMWRSHWIAGDDAYNYGRNHWIGYRLYEIQRDEILSGGSVPRVEKYNWTGIQLTPKPNEPNKRDVKWPVDQNPKTDFGRLAWFMDPSGNTWSYQSDALGNLTKETNPKGEASEYTYDFGFRLKTSKSPEGRTAEYTYDPVTYDLTKVITDPGAGKLNIVKDFEYDSNRNLVKEIGPYYQSDGVQNAPVTTYKYDAKYNSYPESITDKGDNLPNRYSRSFYGPLGHKFVQAVPRITEAVSRGYSMWEYDKAGRNCYAWTSASPSSIATVTRYYGNDLVSQTTDPDGNQTLYEYDGLGNTLKQKTQEDTTNWIHTDYTYNNIGQTQKVEVSRNGENKKTIIEYQYDDFNRLSKIISPKPAAYSDRPIVTFSYDKDGNVSEKKDARGYVTRTIYDDAGRLVNTKYIKPDNTVEKTITYHYDRDGLLRYVWDWTIPGPLPCREYSYDAAGRLTDEVRNDVGRKIQYKYTASGSPELIEIKLSDVTKAKYSYTYYPNGKIKSVEDIDGLVATWTYDARGRVAMKQLTKGSSTVGITRFNYKDAVAPCGYLDATNNLAALTDFTGTRNIAYQGSYKYNKSGNLTFKTERSPVGTATTQYEYDKLSQLLKETRTGSNPFSYIYAYDERGNRKTRTSGGTVLTWYYDDDNRLIRSSNGFSYQYDKTGNLTHKTFGSSVTRYDYDATGSLVKVTLPNNQQIGFTYNSAGERIKRTDTSGTTTYVFAGDDLIEELDASGNVKVYYNPGISQTANGSTKYYKHDRLGSTATMGTATGNTDAFLYDAWGNLINRMGSTNTAFGFVGSEGYYTDADTGLIKLGARYYWPAIGRFITKDPAMDGLNWYAYAGNNPVRNIDPDGLRLRDAIKSAWDWVSGLPARLVAGSTKLNPDTPTLQSRNRTLEELGADDPNIRESYTRVSKAGKAAREYLDDRINETTWTLAAMAVGKISFPGKQIQRKFKHAKDFGVKGNYSKVTGEAFEAAMRSHIEDSATLTIGGTYRGDQVLHHLNPVSGLNVMTDPAGQYISGWKLGADQLRCVLQTGKL